MRRHLLPLLLVSVALLAACGGGESAAPSPAPAPVGDPVEGEKAFNSNGCSGCHLTDTDQRLVGPGLAGIEERAPTRTGQSAEDYIRESITDPRAFTVEGFPPVMPTTFANLPAEEVDNLIAYLLTLK